MKKKRTTFILSVFSSEMRKNVSKDMKNSKAFTLLEVLLALSILIGAVFVFSRVQIRSVMNILKSREYVDRVCLIKKELYKVFLQYPKKEKPIVNFIEQPEMKITTQLSDINKRSSLENFIDTINIIESEGKWKGTAGPAKLKMISFILKPYKKI